MSLTAEEGEVDPGYRRPRVLPHIAAGRAADSAAERVLEEADGAGIAPASVQETSEATFCAKNAHQPVVSLFVCPH